ncbi:MAG: sigma factor-like helix-turn-helix DNA-binding protein [Candidatus Paceibacterota bacterium]
MAIISFRPKHVSKKLLSVLKDRSLDIISNRYGLGDDTKRKTLEAIGQKYGITRERVRQIENAALSSIRKSDVMKSEEQVFEELKELMHSLGSVVHEDEFLSHISDDESIQNHINFYLVLGDAFTQHKEDDQFKTRWVVEHQVVDKIHDALRSLYKSLSTDELVVEGEMINRFLKNIKDLSEEHRDEEILRRWLRLSKKVAKNPLNEWGRAESKNVKTRGVKDYTFLVLRKHGEPMHFKEVAEAITKTFGRKTLAATTHNELIKDPRFVLVGRGKYALREWGYKPGIVRDVIKEILLANGPMKKDEIVDAVLKERFLKRNTILVNLQNSKYFKKLADGKYTVAK